PLISTLSLHDALPICEDQNSNTSLSSLLTKIRSSAKEGSSASPVRIFTIAYSSEANTEALAQIAQASGGQSFDASDPEKINAVLDRKSTRLNSSHVKI